MKLVVAPYDPNWPRLFESERQLLERILEQWLRGGIHHVGSTSVPGLAAKPIIDMIAGVRDLDEARAASSVLLVNGYERTPHRPDVAHHFTKRAAGTPTHHLHLTEPGSPLWRERLAFRDALRADRTLAAEYESIKLHLVEQHNAGRLEYTPSKRPFVARVLAQDGVELQRR